MNDEQPQMMDTSPHLETSQAALLDAIERLMAIDAIALDAALDEATQHIAEVMNADKVDAFIFDESSQTLVALGTSDTPMGRLQLRLGLDRLPLVNGGRYVDVFERCEPFMTGRSDLDELELRGIVDALGARSSITVPLLIDSECRGVLCVISAQPDFYSDEHFRFVTSVSRWLAIVAHRAELVEQITELAVERGRQVAAKELVTILAHDLRNYLSPLKLRIAMMLRKANNEHRTDDARDIGEAAATVDRLTAMVTDMLDAGRLEDGAFALARVQFDLVEHVRIIVSSFQIHDRTIEIDAPDELVICADPDRIQQAIENLLSNAVRYAPTSTNIRIVLGSQLINRERWATISISDQGPGIAPEIMPRLFQRFVAGSESSGLGLGLYIASRIASAHGGRLSADSTPGIGATFQLSIPT